MSNAPVKKLSDQIREQVAKCGKTRREVARLIGINEATMSKFMSGQIWLGEPNIDAIARLLKLRIVKGR